MKLCIRNQMRTQCVFERSPMISTLAGHAFVKQHYIYLLNDSNIDGSWAKIFFEN